MQTELDITPKRTRVDEALVIRLIGLLPEQLVTLRVTICDETGRGWFSWAKFRADTRGGVDVSKQRPLVGSYTDLDAMGLFWSLRPLDLEPTHAFLHFEYHSLTPLIYEFSAAAENQFIAMMRYERFFWVEQQVVRQSLHENGLVGILFFPRKSSPSPCVLLLSGSSGVLREQEAALLATYGYAVLALAYFGVDPLPRYLQEISLEYFSKAIGWLRASEMVANQKIAVVGVSKGGELALLLAATFSEVAAVVSYAPSAYVYQGLGKMRTSSWSYRGQPLPFVAYEPAPIFEVYEQRQLAEGTPIASRGLYLESLEHTAELEQAVIPVERIHGPVLLISGEDDQMWPSTLFADRVEQRLLEYNHPYWHQHLNYADAGHRIGLPNLPTTMTRLRHPVSGNINDYGGTPRGNAQAATYSWQTLLTFLKQHMC